MPNNPIEPDHYKKARVETIEVIESAVDDKASYLHGNVVKYVCRANHKGDQLGDLRKAQWYLARLIDVHDYVPGEVIIDGVECECRNVEVTWVT